MARTDLASESAPDCSRCDRGDNDAPPGTGLSFANGSDGKQPPSDRAPFPLLHLLQGYQLAADGLLHSLAPYEAQDLDEVQRWIVARALACRDVFLICGVAATGKTRLAIEIARALAHRGERILLVGGSQDHIDRLDAALQACRVAYARLFDEEAAQDRARADCPAIPYHLVRRCFSLRKASRLLIERQGLLLRLLEWTKENEQQRLRLIREAECTQEQLRQERRRLEEELRPKLQLLEAEQSGRFYTLRYWKALMAGDLAGQVAAYRARLASVEETLRRVQADLALLREPQHARASAADARRLPEHVAETLARLAQIDLLLDACVQGSVPTRNVPSASRWLENRATLDSACLSDVLDAHRADVQSIAQELQEAETLLAQQTPNVVYTPPDAGVDRYSLVVSDALAATKLPSDSFTIAILDGAERVSLSVGCALASRSKRWIVLADPALWGNGAHRVPGCSNKLDTQQPSIAEILAARLLPAEKSYAEWVRGEHDIRCRFCALDRSVPRRIEIEALADAPEVQLHIAVSERGEASLSEVVFPRRRFTIARAKRLLFEHLGEIPLCRVPALPGWIATADGYRCVLDSRGLASCEGVTYPNGIVEHVCWMTVADGRAATEKAITWAFDFPRAHGWTLQQAQDWLHQHTTCAWAKPSRTAWLRTRYEGTAELNTCLEYLLPGGLVTAATVADPTARERATCPNGPLVWLDPCATGAASSGKKRHGKNAPSRAGGMGRTVHLDDWSHRARLAPEWQVHLPLNGRVHVAEAQFIVAWLGRAVSKWSAMSQGLVAVTSLEPAQAQLIECLWRERAPVSAVGSLAIGPVDRLPRAADVVVVSLCQDARDRVTGWASVEHWLRILLCARRRIVFVGDWQAGRRRAHWHGAVPGQSAQEQKWEQAFLVRLMHFLRQPVAENQVASTLLVD